MFPKVIRAGAGPHDFGSGNNHGETLLPELTMQLISDPDTGSDSGDSSTDYSSPFTSYDPGLELFHNAPSVGRPSSPVVNFYLSV